jgi:secreted trypsin-like serine protease
LESVNVNNRPHAGRKEEGMNHSEIDSYRRWLNRQINKLASNHEQARDTVREAGVRAARLGNAPS